jgi:hypothetical protein
MNQGIIQCFKAYYLAKYIECAITQYDKGITPLDIYSFNQLCAIYLANATW